jgi:hypothetical protein
LLTAFWANREELTHARVSRLLGILKWFFAGWDLKIIPGGCRIGKRSGTAVQWLALRPIIEPLSMWIEKWDGLLMEGWLDGRRLKERWLKAPGW